MAGLETERTDIAALSAAVVAVSVASFVVSGAYDPLTFIVFLSLTVLVCAYAWNSRRTPLQSIAIAMVLGLTITPAVGSILEYNRASDTDKEHLLRYGALWNCNPKVDEGRCKADEKHTDVENYKIILIWAAVTAAGAAYDRSYQRRKFPRASDDRKATRPDCGNA
jgi:hypothetical protein